MTSEEIRGTKSDGYTENFWLRQIALQLAIMNEREAAKQPQSNAVNTTIGGGRLCGSPNIGDGQ